MVIKTTPLYETKAEGKWLKRQFCTATECTVIGFTTKTNGYRYFIIKIDYLGGQIKVRIFIRSLFVCRNRC